MRTLTDMMKKIGLLALSLLVFSPAMAQSAPQAEDPFVVDRTIWVLSLIHI